VTSDSQVVRIVDEAAIPSPTAEAVARSLMLYYESKRSEALARVAFLEAQLGYGADGRPTTAQIREWFRTRRRACPHCGENITIG
jgi:hypothetical protein